ncbi:hypothetical protein, partial [Leptospira wolffii]
YARDNIIHHGSSFPSIYHCERGFGIDAEILPFSKYSLWKNEKLEKNKIAPLRTALGFIILKTIEACNDFSQTIQSTVQFPPMIAPGFQLYMRSEYIGELNNLSNVVENCLWDTE